MHPPHHLGNDRSPRRQLVVQRSGPELKLTMLGEAFRDARPRPGPLLVVQRSGPDMQGSTLGEAFHCAGTSWTIVVVQRSEKKTWITTCFIAFCHKRRKTASLRGFALIKKTEN
jgi:hypothetical protein